METDSNSSPLALKMRVGCSSYTLLSEEGAVPQHMWTYAGRLWAMAANVFVNLTLVYSLSIKSSQAEYITVAD